VSGEGKSEEGSRASPSFNSLTKDGLINKSITHTRGAGGMNAYRVDKDRGEDVDKIGGCPRVLVVEQRGVRHGINVWPPRQNIHARSPGAPAAPPPLTSSLGPSRPLVLSSPAASSSPPVLLPLVAMRSGSTPKIIANHTGSLISGMQQSAVLEGILVLVLSSIAVDSTFESTFLSCHSEDRFIARISSDEEWNLEWTRKRAR